MILWKRGVVERGDFARYALEQECQHRGWWPFSYNILQDLEEHYTPPDEQLLDRLYSSLAAGAGICKITRRGRFEDFDEKIVSSARQEFPQTTELVIHDMGASSAITSLELYLRFAQERGVRFVASDYFDRLSLVSLPQSRWTVTFDSQDRPIQTTGTSTIYGTKLYSWRYAFLRLVQHWVNWRVIPAAQGILRDGPPHAIRRVSLFHPEAVVRSRQDSQFQLIRHNIFNPNPVPCDIVRAMNVMTPKHFTREQTQTAIRASIHHLQEGGWLILGRSIDEEDGRLRASVFELRDESLVPLWHENEGYEWPELVAELRFHATSRTR